MNDIFFQWVQLKHAIPTIGKHWFLITVMLKRTTCIKIIALLQELEFCLATNKGNSVLISNIVKKPTSNIYFEKLFENTKLDLSKLYPLSCLTAIDTTLRSFRCKILNNVFFLNKKLYTFGITNITLIL